VAVPLLAGDETRIVALWFSRADSAYSSDVLDMDLDLAVLAPGGAVVASSISAANPFELASFVPPSSGTYTVRLTRQRFDGPSEPLTVAWSTRRDAAQATIRLAPGSQPFEAGLTPTLELAEPFEGAGKSYAAWVSLSGPPGMALPGTGLTQPIGFDWYSELSLLLPGFVGQLDAQGRASASLPLPGVAAAVGRAVGRAAREELALPTA